MNQNCCEECIQPHSLGTLYIRFCRDLVLSIYGQIMASQRYNSTNGNTGWFIWWHNSLISDIYKTMDVHRLVYVVEQIFEHI